MDQGMTTDVVVTLLPMTRYDLHAILLYTPTIAITQQITMIQKLPRYTLPFTLAPPPITNLLSLALTQAHHAHRTSLYT